MNKQKFGEAKLRGNSDSNDSFLFLKTSYMNIICLDIIYTATNILYFHLSMREEAINLILLDFILVA